MESGKQTCATVAKETALDGFLTRLSSQNSRFISNLQQLENMGHKLIDTNTTEKATEKEPREEPGSQQGTLHQIDRHLNYYANHNARLEGIIEKLSELI